MPEKRSKNPKSKVVSRNKVTVNATKTSQKKLTRQIKQPAYKSFRLHKRIRHTKPLPGSFWLFRQSIKQLARHWRLFGGIVVVYLLLNILLVKGLGAESSIGDLKTALQEVFQGNNGQLLTSLTLFSVLLGSTGSTPNQIAGAYQAMLVVVASLALIWALRQTQASGKVKVKVKTAFYNGMYPLIPFLLVVLVIALQLLPLLAGSFLYTVMFAGGLAVSGPEQVIWYTLIGLLTLLSLYMLSSSLFALYIVTLPDFTPLQALRTARLRVLHRRLKVLQRLVFLPIALFIIAAVVVVPVIMLSAVVAEWLFYVLSVCALAVIHSYMYNLYRELIKE